VTAVGRNDPCPCGSGVKYKRCCLGKAATPRGAFTAAERDQALAALFRFAEREEFLEAHERAEASFWGDLDELPADELDELMDDEQSQFGYLTWFAFDFVLDDGRLVVEHFLERHGERLRAGEREYLSRMRASHLRPYEVLEVAPDAGLRLLDLWSHERLWVRERAATSQLVRWDLLAARLVRGAEGDWILDGVPYALPAAEREDLLRSVRRAHARVARQFPGVDEARFFKGVAPLFHRWWLDRAAFPPPPALRTAEGDPLVLARASFDVHDRTALLRALAGHPELDRQDDGSFVWGEEAEDFRRSLGRFILGPDRLVFETTSKQRVERGRAFLEELVGDAVRFRATRLRDAWAAAREGSHGAGPAPPPDVPPEVEAELVGDFYERHYRGWPDTPLPALGGRTPRHAARLKTVRPRLVALLKDMEARSERLRRDGRPAYDFGWMWAELGLDRPE
jgi:hypothetical protein